MTTKTATHPWQVYIVRCADGTLYTGVTTDLRRRIDEHNGKHKGARYTRARQPVALVYNEPCASRSDACKRERAIKSLPVAIKRQLISSLKP